MLRAALVATVAVLVLAACESGGNSRGGNPACTSHYDPVADASSKAALKEKLLDVRPDVRSLRIIDDERPDKVTVNLVNRRDRLVMSLDMWRKDDGTWTAQRWSQCID